MMSPLAIYGDSLQSGIGFSTSVSLDKPLYNLLVLTYTMTKRHISSKVTSKENSKLIEDEKLSKAEKDLVKKIDKLNKEYFDGVSYIRYGGRD